MQRRGGCGGPAGASVEQHRAPLGGGAALGDEDSLARLRRGEALLERDARRLLRLELDAKRVAFGLFPRVDGTALLVCRVLVAAAVELPGHGALHRRGVPHRLLRRLLPQHEQLRVRRALRRLRRRELGAAVGEPLERQCVLPSQLVELPPCLVVLSRDRRLLRLPRHQLMLLRRQIGARGLVPSLLRRALRPDLRRLDREPTPAVLRLGGPRGELRAQLRRRLGVPARLVPLELQRRALALEQRAQPLHLELPLPLLRRAVVVGRVAVAAHHLAVHLRLARPLALQRLALARRRGDLSLRRHQLVVGLPARLHLRLVRAHQLGVALLQRRMHLRVHRRVRRRLLGVGLPPRPVLLLPGLHLPPRRLGRALGREQLRLELRLQPRRRRLRVDRRRLLGRRRVALLLRRRLQREQRRVLRPQRRVRAVELGARLG